MQQLVRMHFAQAVEQLGEHVAQEILGDHRPVLLDQLLQCAPVLVFHHHVDGVVGAEKVEHPNDVGVRKACQRAPFLEEALHPVAEGGHVLVADQRADRAFAAQGQRVGQIFLDGDELAVLVGRQIDDGKPAQRKLAFDPVGVELEAWRQGVVGLLRHREGGYDLGSTHFRGLRPGCKAGRTVWPFPFP